MFRHSPQLRRRVGPRGDHVSDGPRRQHSFNLIEIGYADPGRAFLGELCPGPIT